MADKKLTSAEVVYALVAAKAVGRLTVSGDDPVVITGPVKDKEAARAVLKSRGLTFTKHAGRDEWSRR